MNIEFTYLPGDGIGPEVGDAAITVLNAMAAGFGHTLAPQHHLIGGAAIDAVGSPLPAQTIDSARQTQAILLGAVGGPKWDHLKASDRPELGGLLAIRKALDLYANVRPAKPYKSLLGRAPLKRKILKNVDFVVMRELTGGIYFGAKGRDNHGAYDECAYTDAEIERIAVRAFQLAKTRRAKVTSVDKANVLETSRLWRDVVTRVHQQFPEVELEHILVDAAAMYLLSRPRDFDVILTENMFGDILTDEASMLCGSMGVIPSASFGPGEMGLFEPIHGSAPDIAGKGLANPIAMILSAAWMLRARFGLEDEAAAIERAVEASLERAEVTPDLGGELTTQGVGISIARHLEAKNA